MPMRRRWIAFICDSLLRHQRSKLRANGRSTTGHTVTRRRQKHIRTAPIVVALFALGGALVFDRAFARDAQDSSMAVLEKAKSWRAGDPIPEVLRRFHHSAGDLPSPLDSYSLISSIENLDLLAALTVDQNADWRCREDAVTQGLYVGGPTRFFGLLRPRLTDAGVAHNSWYSELIERSSRPHVVVDALSISYSD